MLNYLSNAELFVLLWIISSMAFGIIIALWCCRKDIVNYFHKTPDQRALDWVNRQIERNKR